MHFVSGVGDHHDQVDICGLCLAFLGGVEMELKNVIDQPLGEGGDVRDLAYL